jgi:hypothetical protein
LPCAASLRRVALTVQAISEQAVNRLFVAVALAFLPGEASAGLFLTDNPTGADLWVVITENGGLADCWIHSSDISSRPLPGDLWAMVTETASVADKWITITDSYGLADPVECLLAE